ncbi:MAG: hypothetical protein LBP19_10625, partial [Treponema sp.]|nr:hypothetical protein [Treponema sp.]
VYIPRIMAEITRRCNNNNEIDSSGIPDFIGIEIGDYIDGLDLSAIPAENGGDGGQAWNGTYKSIRSQRRIRSSGIMGVGISCVCRRVCHFLPSW